MSTQEAIGIVAQVAAQFRGTLKEHEIIQQALAVIEERLETQAQAQAPRHSEPATKVAS